MTDMDGLRGAFTITFGALALLGGLLMLGAEIASVPHRSAEHLAFFGVLALSGAALLATLWRPARLTAPLAAVVAAVGVAGTAAGLLVERVTVCCMFAYHQTRGFPFPWLGRGFTSDENLTGEQAAARMDATGIDWGVQDAGARAIADVIFWAGVALIVIVAVRLAAAALAYAGQRDREPEPDAEPVDA
jgi:hypothetical protein